LRNLTALIEAEWQGEGIRIACELDPTLPPVGADEELLRQAFLNMLQNAGQAMPKGGTVTIRTTCQGRDVVRVDIADEGVGIARDDLERVFKLYYTTKPEGTGIGLSVAYRIVPRHAAASGAVALSSTARPLTAGEHRGGRAAPRRRAEPDDGDGDAAAPGKFEKARRAAAGEFPDHRESPGQRQGRALRTRHPARPHARREGVPARRGSRPQSPLSVV